jgi:hypothetical protein
VPNVLHGLSDVGEKGEDAAGGEEEEEGHPAVVGKRPGG